MLVDVGLDGLDQLGNIAEDAASQPVLRQVAEETLDHVQPRGTRRGEMKVEARMAFEPALGFVVFVGRGVVENQMQFFVRRRHAVDVAQKPQPLLMPIALLADADHRAVERIERRKSSRYALRL